MGKKARVVYFEMGPWPIYVGFTQSPEAFAAEMKRLSIDDAPSFIQNTHSHATTHYFTKDNGLTCIITLGSTKGRSRAQIAALIAHEAVHVGQELWANIGETEPGKEAEAYLVQHVTQCCLAQIERLK